MGTNPGASQSSHFAEEQKRGDSSQAWGSQTWLLGARPLNGTGERGDLSRGQENPGLLSLSLRHGGLLRPEAAGSP